MFDLTGLLTLSGPVSFRGDAPPGSDFCFLDIVKRAQRYIFGYVEGQE